MAKKEKTLLDKNSMVMLHHWGATHNIHNTKGLTTGFKSFLCISISVFAGAIDSGNKPENVPANGEIKKDILDLQKHCT